MEHLNSVIPANQLFWLNQSSQHFMPAGGGKSYRTGELAPEPWGVFLVGLAAGIVGNVSSADWIFNQPLSIGQGDHLPLMAKPESEK